MKKHSLKHLAVAGLVAGLVISTSSLEACGGRGSKSKKQIMASLDNEVLVPELATMIAANLCKNSPENKKIAEAKKAKKDAEIAAVSKTEEYDPNSGNLGFHEMTDDEMLMELTPEGAKLYNSLTPEGKTLARQVASVRCNHTNPCRGLNACKTDKNDCAGKGACKGQGKCAFSSKDLAVKVVADKMGGKRSAAMQH